MSNRERWILYPLLFMTLGIAMRDKVIPPSHLEAGAIATPRIHCNELQVGQIVCDRMESKQSECRTLFVTGPTGQPVVVAGTDSNTGAGVVETLTANGVRQVRLFSSDTGGVVSTIERAGKIALILGDTGQTFGLFAEVTGLGQLIPLTLPYRLEAKPAPAKPPKRPTSQDQSTNHQPRPEAGGNPK